MRVIILIKKAIRFRWFKLCNRLTIPYPARPQLSASVCQEESGRIKHAPNRGWLPFCVAFAPLCPELNLPFSSTRKLPFLWEVLLFLQDLLYESTVFLHRKIGGKRWCEMVTLNLVHVWFSWQESLQIIKGYLFLPGPQNILDKKRKHQLHHNIEGHRLLEIHRGNPNTQGKASQCNFQIWISYHRRQGYYYCLTKHIAEILQTSYLSASVSATKCDITLQPEIIVKLIPKTFFM